MCEGVPLLLGDLIEFVSFTKTASQNKVFSTKKGQNLMDKI